MKDHLLHFDSEADAIAALPRFRVGEGKEAGWDTSRCIPDTKVWRQAASAEMLNPETGAKETVETREYMPGWFIQVGLEDEDADLKKMARATITDRESKVASKLDAAIDAEDGWHIEPVFAG